jgi:hypothetical protein
MITLRGDLDSITQILNEAFETEPFKRDYDFTFAKIATIIGRYGLIENPRNLRFRFILCMQEFFDRIPQDQWRLKDPAFVKQSEDFAIASFRTWVMEQVV